MILKTTFQILCFISLSLNYANCNYRSRNATTYNWKFHLLGNLKATHITNYTVVKPRTKNECFKQCQYDDGSCNYFYYRIKSKQCIIIQEFPRRSSLLGDAIMFSKQNIFCPGFCTTIAANFLCGTCKCIDMCSSYIPYICDCTQAFPNEKFKKCEGALSANKYQTGLYKLALNDGDERAFMCSKKKEEKSCDLITGNSHNDGFLHRNENHFATLDNCINICSVNAGSVPFDGILIDFRNLDCWCKKNMRKQIYPDNNAQHCRIGFYMKEFIWTTILELKDKAFYSENYNQYENEIGNIGSGQYWVGLKNLYQLLSMENQKGWTLRVEYNMKGRREKIVMDYQDFKTEGSETEYRLSYSQYRRVKTHDSAADVLKCSRNQPFRVANGQAFWGIPIADSVPFHNSILYWGVQEASFLRMSLREKVTCEEILGDYNNAIIYMEEDVFVGYFYESSITKFNITEYQNVKSGDVTCKGKIQFHKRVEKVDFEYKLNKCELKLKADDPYEKNKWNKIRCEIAESYGKCDDVVKDLGCPEGKYRIENKEEDCKK